MSLSSANPATRREDWLITHCTQLRPPTWRRLPEKPHSTPTPGPPCCGELTRSPGAAGKRSRRTETGRVAAALSSPAPGILGPPKLGADWQAAPHSLRSPQPSKLPTPAHRNSAKMSQARWPPWDSLALPSQRPTCWNVSENYFVFVLQKPN